MTDTMDLDETGEPVPSFGTRATVAPKDFHRDLQRAVVFSLEEGMNTKAIDLLCQVSYAGISTPAKPGVKKEIAVPPPEVLSILTTISLHPAFTTRRTGTLQLDAALKASRYIRTIIRLAGATNCHLQQAWRFKRSIDGPAASDDEANTRRRTRNRNVVKAPPVGRRGKRAAAAEIDTAPFANLPIANEESLFRLSDDIWAVIGWAMVCSCRYPKRWDLWRDFLDLLLETLEADFKERLDAAETPEDMDLEGSLANTIGFLPDMVGGAGYKRIVRAIFANGSDKSRNEWTPVFPKETKKPPRSNGIKDWQATLDSGLQSGKSRQQNDVYTAIRKNAEKMKDIRLNIDESSDAYRDFRAELARKGAFGDGFDADREESEDEDDRHHDTGDTQLDDKAHPETDEHAMEVWGGIDSIVMRLKFMSLISYLFAHDSQTLECFYSEYVDCLRCMSVKQMSLFTSPAIYTAAYTPFRASLLTRTLQHSMVWQPRNGWQTDVVTEETLREYYLPHHARGNDVEAQVRMATLVEYLARLWHVQEGISWDEGLQAAVDAGIAARREKAEAAAGRRKKAPTAVDKQMLSMLGMAEMRLQFLVQSAKNATITQQNMAS
ncbi:hypothetical protein TWF696_003617 [Orbilia brochopaga]|uniref:Uncharacterized protein n=1 Tax=Orbilia brochopaga TaxID=3140254 RepID=A0AAV9TYF2_9PEZI